MEGDIIHIIFLVIGFGDISAGSRNNYQIIQEMKKMTYLRNKAISQCKLTLTQRHLKGKRHKHIQN